MLLKYGTNQHEYILKLNAGTTGSSAKLSALLSRRTKCFYQPMPIAIPHVSTHSNRAIIGAAAGMGLLSRWIVIWHWRPRTHTYVRRFISVFPNGGTTWLLTQIFYVRACPWIEGRLSCELNLLHNLTIIHGLLSGLAPCTKQKAQLIRQPQYPLGNDIQLHLRSSTFDRIRFWPEPCSGFR